MKRLFIILFLLTACAKPSDNSSSQSFSDPVIYRDKNIIFFDKTNVLPTDYIGFPRENRNVNFNIEATCFMSNGNFNSKITGTSVDSKILVKSLIAIPKNVFDSFICNLLLSLKNNDDVFIFDIQNVHVSSLQTAPKPICIGCF